MYPGWDSDETIPIIGLICLPPTKMSFFLLGVEFLGTGTGLNPYTHSLISLSLSFPVVRLRV